MGMGSSMIGLQRKAASDHPTTHLLFQHEIKLIKFFSTLGFVVLSFSIIKKISFIPTHLTDDSTAAALPFGDADAEADAAPLQQDTMISSRDPDAVFSGGGISSVTGSQTANFTYGYSSFKGKRASMGYFYETRISEVDGHGGSRTAEYLKSNLFKNLSSHPDFIKDTKTAIVEAFRQTDADYLDEEKGQQKDAASTALLLGNRLLVANVGDSGVVACRAGSGCCLF